MQIILVRCLQNAPMSPIEHIAHVSQDMLGMAPCVLVSLGLNETTSLDWIISNLQQKNIMQNNVHTISGGTFDLDASYTCHETTTTDSIFFESHLEFGESDYR